MELKKPRPKKHNKLVCSTFLHLKKYSGYFNDFSVIITDAKSIQELYTTGCFGKGNLSRSYPLFSKDETTQMVRKRVFSHRKNFSAGLKATKKIIVLPDSDSENEYFTNLTPEYCTDSCSLMELLHLTLEEAYFLSYFCDSLDVYHNNNLITSPQMWDLFSKDKYFIQNYAAYHYFRSKNWIVKPGIKFGGDYLLYKDGPAFFHASYLVIIDILDAKTLKRKIELCRRSMDVINVIGLNRLCETVGKELLICQILWPSESAKIEPSDLQKLQISEVLMRRWIPSENRDLEY